MRPSLKLWLATWFGLGFLLIGATILLRFNRPSPSSSTPPLPTSDSQRLPTPSVTINNQALTVELADTPEKQRQGLGGHEPLTDAQGMLFPYDPPQPVTFWMKNMTFPIDIIYIANERVVQIFADVPPPGSGVTDNDLTRYPSERPIDYVLETRAGWTRDHRIAVADPVTFDW